MTPKAFATVFLWPLIVFLMEYKVEFYSKELKNKKLTLFKRNWFEIQIHHKVSSFDLYIR